MEINVFSPDVPKRRRVLPTEEIQDPLMQSRDRQLVFFMNEGLSF